MRLYAGGVLTNEYNDVLLIRRDDSRTFAVPGGGVEAHELPPETAAREVEEETGVKVLPIRLVDLQYRPEAPDGILLFVFRCLQRGGEPRSSDESYAVGFYKSHPLPRPMLGIHHRILTNSISHRGGPPNWYTTRLPLLVRGARLLIYGFRDLRRRLRSEPVFGGPPEWTVAAFVIILDAGGRALWVRRRDQDVWNLPGGRREGLEAPWETAVRETREETGLNVELTDLTGVYSKPADHEVIFAFTARTLSGELTLNAEAAEFAYFEPGSEPPNSLARHVARVADAVAPGEETVFRNHDQEPAPSDTP